MAKKYTIHWFVILSLVNFLGLLLLALICWSLYKTTQEIKIAQAVPASAKITSVTYTCDTNKKIQALYFGNTVEISLSDKRNFLLTQAVSASGIRYTDANESVTFWSKGNTAFFEEGTASTYNNCNAVH